MKKIFTIVLAIVLALFFCLPAAAGAATPRVDFIDVASWNSAHGLPLSFYQTIKRGGVNGVVVKVSEGTSYLNPNASVDIANASQAGLVVSAYHFFRAGSTSAAKSEAKFFDKQLKYVGFSKLNDGIVTADIETTNGASRSTLTAAANTFITEMQQLGYPTVDVYSGSYFYNSNLDPSKLQVKDPWLASYVYNPQSGHPTAKFSQKRGAWQWASDYHFSGFNGNFDVSEDYAGKYSKQYMAPNATPTGVAKKIKSISLLDYMKSHGYGSTWAAQVKLATAYGITGYVGSAAQNLALLSKLQNGVKPAPKPVFSKPAAARTTGTAGSYTVKSGDSLWAIATAHKMTVAKLMSLNGLRSTVIYPGQRFKLSGSATIAVKKSPVAAVRSYTVRSGDSLWIISLSKKTTVAHLMSTNHLKSSLIYPGQKLKY